MLYGMYLSAGGLLANQYRMEVLANNLANTDTAGFKQDLTVVRERMIASRERLAGLGAGDRGLDGMTGGSLVAPTHTAFEQGAIEKTGNPLDAALQGEGFFRVGTSTGEAYTRDGRFVRSDTGELVTVAGAHPVLDSSGSPIVIPAQASGQVRIDGNGEVRAGDLVCGTLGVVDFEDKAMLRKVGGNLFEPLGGEPVRVDPNLVSGAVEKSTVDPVHSMVSMIEVSRAYQANATLLGLADTTLGRAVNDVGRVG